MPRFNLDDYVDVQERISQFWERYPEGRIFTEMVSKVEDFERVVFVSSVYRLLDDVAPIATGWASEVAGGVGANQACWHENCETSAIGRALANAGFATKGRRPSREEMDKAQRGESQPSRPQSRDTAPAPARPVTQAQDIGVIAPGQLDALKRMANELEMVLDDRVAADYELGSVSMLTMEQAGNLIVALDKELREYRAAKRLVTA